MSMQRCLVWNRLKAVAESNGGLPRMLQVLNAARQAEPDKLTPLNFDP